MEHTENRRPADLASPAQDGQSDHVSLLGRGRDSAEMVPDSKAGSEIPVISAKPQRPITSIFSDSGGGPVVTDQLKPAEKPIAAADHAKAQNIRIEGLLRSGRQVPNSPAILVRITTRDDAEAVMEQVPPGARRGFVREVLGQNDHSQNHIVGFFSIDPAERETWNTQKQTPQQSGKDIQQDTADSLFSHDSGRLTREELAFALQVAEEKNDEQIAFIKSGTRFGRLDSATMDRIETERHRSRMEVKLISDAAAAIAPEPPGIHAAASDMSHVEIIEDTPEVTYDNAREQLTRQLATADSKTFDAIREWTQHKNDYLRMEAALRHHVGTGTPLTEAQVRDARAFRDTDNDMQDKCNGPDGARYRKSQRLFQEALFIYEQSTPLPSSAAENQIDSSTERQRHALAAFLEDFDKLDSARVVDVYHDARVALIKELGNNTSGTPFFEAIMARLEHRKAIKEVEYLELRKGKGDDAFIEDQQRLAGRRVSDANALLLDLTIEDARLGLQTVRDAFHNYMKLSSSDIRIPARDGTSMTKLQREIMIMEKIMADMRALPAPETKNGSESVTIYQESPHKDATGTASEQARPEQEFGRKKKEDFKIIARIAEAYARNNPSLVQNAFTLFQTSAPGVFNHRDSMRIRDVLQLSLGTVTVVHEGQITRQYEVQIQLASIYDGWKDERSGTFSWFQSGKKVELPSYMPYPRNPLVTVPYYYKDSETTSLEELPESFNLSGITLKPIDPQSGTPSEGERYRVSVIQNGDKTAYRIYGTRGEGRQTHALRMNKTENRTKLKEILEQLPKAA